MKASLPIAVTNRIYSIFTANGWNVNAEDEKYEYYTGLFDKFRQLLAQLNEEEIELVLKLTEDYLYLPMPLYWSRFSSVLPRLSAAIPSHIENAIIMPIMQEKDFGYIKSGSFPLYYLRKKFEQNAHNLGRLNSYALENPGILLEKHSDRTETAVIFVDDFIGTGTYAAEVLEYY